MRVLLTITFLSVAVAALQGCYYDVDQELYPTPTTAVCDTGTISFSQRIQPIITTNCYGSSCHDDAAPGGGIDLTTHTGVANNIGSIIPAIKHTGGTPMPIGGNMLPTCDIQAFETWQSQGLLDN